MDTERSSVIQAAAKTWFGYGDWHAPYWFVGMEQGGDPEERSYRVWQQLGAGELLDCREHHLAIDDSLFRRWHDGPKPRTQPTWRGLIQILLSFKGVDASTEAVRNYQSQNWGSSSGETAVIELSALRARNLKSLVARTDFRTEHIDTVRDRIAQYKPAFVVCYGLGYREDYQRIAGSVFDPAGFTVSGRTLFALVKHPTSFGVKSAEFMQFGKEIRRRLELPSQS